MNISDIIRQAREGLGLTQEDLAERLEVSRQAVSKWELGASVPSPENLALLEEVLGVSFPAPEEAAALPEQEPGTAEKAPFWNWKRVALLVLGVLVVLALFSNVIFIALTPKTNVDVVRPSEPYISGVYFFNEDAGQLQHDPQAGAGWYLFAPDSRVYLLVTFEDGTENTVSAVSLFLTPTGTETLEYREQIGVQAAGEGRDFALFAWDIPEALTAHLEIVLECGGGDRVTETLGVATPYPETPEEAETLTIPGRVLLFMDDPYRVLRASGAPEEEIVWTSSDPAVVEVTGIGTLFPVSPGAAAVTAEWNGQTAECQVEVFTGTEPTDVPGVSKVVQ
ncbi:helix-turn-helix domain-containing protein [Oscillibacter sp.]|uniref:helix-turn-helix domain-containing protein n=1 Tax=Oscillibacter sp. TaxID=1945593 RepID=UPI002D8112D0|nr:helix-turn-helix domain-containing protein [Oscillibacter sp.]